MKMRQLLFTLVALPLFVAILGMLVWGGGPAVAAFTTALSSALIGIKGTVSGTPESVSFSGQAKISSKMVTDPDFGNPPTVVLSIDLSKVTGVGTSTGQTYVTSSQVILDRRLTAADTVQVPFPFSPSGGSALSARVGMASFNLSFNVNTGMLTGATAGIASP
jgi:hypothetical protein